MSAWPVAPAACHLGYLQFSSCSSTRGEVATSPVFPEAEDEQRWRERLCPPLAGCRGIPQLKQIHALALRSSNTCIPTVTSSSNRDFLFLYSRILHSAASDSGDLHYATRILDHLLLLADSGAVQLPSSSSFFWNTLIRAHARSFHLQHAAIELYRRMLLDGRVSPDKYTFPFVLRACAYLFKLPEGEQVHGHALKFGLSADVYVANSLVHFYATCERLEPACRIFDGMQSKSLVSWNAIIDGFVAGGRYDAALGLFREMQREFKPDCFSMQSLIAACEGLGALSLGMWAHAFVLKRCGDDAPDDVLVNNSLVDMYAKCGSLVLARQVFDRMPRRNLASWNAMILGFAMHGAAKESMQTFARMEEEGVQPNEITYVGILSACCHAGLVREGRAHLVAMADQHGLEPRLEHYGCVVDLLARAGLVDEALDLISTMACKPDAVIWRSILDACWKSNAEIEVGESMARQVVQAEGEECTSSSVFVLLSRIYASANRWNEVELVRKLMSEKAIRKVPGCSSIEIGGTVHEFLAGDTPCSG